MAIQKAPESNGPQAGRKAAYFARNEANILKATQHVLANMGWSAKVSDVAKTARVAPSTIYMHFENKDLLFQAALQAAMVEWEGWALEQVAVLTDPLELLVAPMRLYVRGSQTHPELAKLVVSNPGQVSPLALSLSSGLLAHVQALVSHGLLSIDHVEIRVANLAAIVARVLHEQVSNSNSKVESADLALQLALPMIGISEADAARLMSLPLPMAARPQVG